MKLEAVPRHADASTSRAHLTHHVATCNISTPVNLHSHLSFTPSAPTGCNMDKWQPEWAVAGAALAVEGPQPFTVRRNEETSTSREPYPTAFDNRPRASLPRPSAGPSDFDELCMKVIKAGDMTSVIDDKVRDEVRFEVAVAMVYAQMNPHIIEGGGRKKALDSNSTVQALWRRIAVECGFSEHEKPDPQGSKLTKVTKYARTILTENWIQIQLPSFRAWRGREFMTHIEGLESLIDGFNAYDPEVCFALRRLAEKCKRAAGSDVASQPPTTVQSSAFY